MSFKVPQRRCGPCPCRVQTGIANHLEIATDVCNCNMMAYGPELQRTNRRMIVADHQTVIILIRIGFAYLLSWLGTHRGSSDEVLGRGAA